jgi:large subunit ribosomal protein L30
MAETKEQQRTGARLRIRQIASASGRKPDQKATIRALGLGRVGYWRELPDTPVIRGMVRRVAHLVKVETLGGEG